MKKIDYYDCYPIEAQKKRLDWIEERKKEYNNDFEKFAEFVYNTYVEV